jgi:hypothetical protein
MVMVTELEWWELERTRDERSAMRFLAALMERELTRHKLTTGLTMQTVYDRPALYFDYDTGQFSVSLRLTGSLLHTLLEAPLAEVKPVLHELARKMAAGVGAVK